MQNLLFPNDITVYFDPEKILPLGKQIEWVKLSSFEEYF